MSDQYATFRRKRGDELIRFATALQGSSIQCDVSSLTAVGSTCYGSKPLGRGSWGYDLQGLILHGPDPVGHIRPIGAKLTSIQINVRVAGKCQVSDNSDPIESLGVEIILNGETQQDDKKVSLQSCWYMDRYDSTSDRVSEDGAIVIKSPVHPHYHFQFGGINMKSINPGRMIVASPPRIAHPPMDALLTTDFVISNYFSSKWLRLRSESNEYLSLIRKSQRRLWRPYVDALNRNWDRPTPRMAWEAVDVWPHLHQ